MSESEALRMRLDDFKIMTRNTLRGFATITIEPMGLTIEDVHVHQAAGGTCYALLPSKPQVRSDGTVIRRDDGRVAYSPVLRFANRESGDRFSIAVIQLIQRRFPEALAMPSGEDAA
jgi:hypothetical protein